MSSLMIRLLVTAMLLAPGAGHGMLTCPSPRQRRDEKVASWTCWQGITSPGDGSFAPGEGNAASFNAAIGGGAKDGTFPGAEPGGHTDA